MAAEAKIGNARPANGVTKFFKGIVKFFKDVKAEFKKITWPTRDNVMKTTGTVFGVLAIFTVIIWLYDTVFSYALKAILDLF